MVTTKQRMQDMLPPYYAESPEVDALTHAEAIEFDRKRTEARGLLDQFFVRSATWGLDDWERVLALPPLPNTDVAFRRQRILSKLNGTAPATVRYMTDLVNVHVDNNSARIVEYNGEYRFEAEVTAGDGVINTADIYHAVEEVKPAHLAFGLTAVVREELRIKARPYKFGVPYRICNMFKTAAIPGGALRTTVQLGERSYSFAVDYAKTNVLRASGTTLRKTSKMALIVHTAPYTLEFKRANDANMITGEVTL